MVCCGFLWELMKGKKPISPVKAVRTDILSKYSSDLSSYTSDCKKDISLQSFDAMIHFRTNRIISSLAAQTKTQSLSVESLMEVNGFLLELNEEAVRVIIESREDVQKNKDLKSLVDVYFKSTSKTLDFCNIVENCVKKTEISQLLIGLALKQFEKESVDTSVEGSKKKYAKTLEELNKFKAMGDPFDGDFLSQFNSVYEQQILLLEELRNLKAKLEKKQRNIKTYKILSNVFFVTTFVFVFVLSVVSAAMIAPPVVGLIAAVLVPTENARNWFNKMWKGYEKAVEREINLVSSLESSAQINNVEVLNNIKSEVENLRINISSILYTVDTVVDREEEKEMVMSLREIKKKVDGFSEKIEQVGENVAKYRRYIASGRLTVLEHMVLHQFPVVSSL